MEFLDREHQGACLDRHKNGSFIDADRQGRDRHRRRRHRHGLRRHFDAPRLQEPGAGGDHAASRRWNAPTDNPWPEWPKVYKLDYGQEEAAAKFGADPRVYLTTATKFERRRARPRQSRPHRASGMGAERQGPVHPEECARHGKGLARATRACWRWVSSGRNSRCSIRSASNAIRASNAKAEFEKYTTNIKGVFAAGDCRRGQSLVVWAFNEGRGAARECDRYLMGATELP